MYFLCMLCLSTALCISVNTSGQTQMYACAVASSVHQVLGRGCDRTSAKNVSEKGI